MSTSRVMCKSRRASSSYSVSSEPILEDVREEIESGEHLQTSDGFDLEARQPIMENLTDTSGGGEKGDSGRTVETTETTESATTETRTGRTRRKPNEAEIVRTKIKYHFMNPYQKYKARGRKPWKLLIQIFKIIIVTTQVALFGFDRFSVVNFLENNRDVFHHLFIKGYNHTSFSIYTREDVYSYLHYAHTQYYHVRELAVGSYDYTLIATDGTVPPVQLCYSYFKKGEINPNNNTYDFDPDIERDCIWLDYIPHHGEKHLLQNISFRFSSLLFVNLRFSLKSMNIKRLKTYDKPTCYQFDIEVHLDNTRHDGRMPVDLLTNSTFLPGCKGKIEDADDVSGSYIKYCLVVFDFVVITVCLVSFALTVRSLIRSFWLARDVAKFFKENRHEELKFSELIVFLNLWFILIVISDLLTIVGSFYKVFIDQKDSDYYNVCSLFLGIAVLLVWTGLLRFLGYLKQYNVLLLTLKAAAPSVMRFMICTVILFVGYLLCGWIVLGPYHRKFKNLTVSAECMYSLLNGDDMYATFQQMNTRSTASWIFSKLYLYSFISLFIYVVLSLFIGIICDTYERLKDIGESMAATRIVTFLNESTDDDKPTERSGDHGRSNCSGSASCSLYSGQRQLWRSVSTLTGDSIMRRVSVDSTGAE